MKTKYLIKKILRKIYHFIGFMTIFMICLLPVKADTIFDLQYGGSGYTESWYLQNISVDMLIDLTNSTNIACTGLSDCYSRALGIYESSNYTYYSLYLSIYPQATNMASDLQLRLFNFPNTSILTQTIYTDTNKFYYNMSDNGGSPFVVASVLDGFSDPYRNVFYGYYDSNYNFTNLNNDTYLFKNFFDNENDNPNNYLQVGPNESIPKLKDLINYSSWSDYQSNYVESLTTVNLDDYDYVLLTLKNYNQSNAFQSNLQVKGQIGITPIYNYGQTSKDSVTGSQVQDRCNASYSNYTSYPLYILQSDLQNNVVYAVKSCSENSSFKFDSNVFDITYVTASNRDDPTITINGNTYHTIPYSELPSTATKNETDNYIPGESYNFVDSGIDSLNSALKQSGNWLSSIWSTITYFMQFIGLILSSLPPELHAILISAFTITIIIGLLKHFTG